MNIAKKIVGISTIITAGVLTSTAASAATMVGTELLLSIDVSGSVSGSEFTLQRDGYAQAFESQSVIDAIEDSPNGIAVALSYWATNDTALEIDWTQLTTAADSQAFADIIRNTPRNGSGSTGVGRAITFGTDSILNNDFDGSRLVIDVSGDGTNNTGIAPATARDTAVGSGIIINGLTIGSESLRTYYENNVIGGTGAFVESVNDFADVGNAATRKITREIDTGGGNPNTVPEPTTIAGLLAVTALGAIFKRKGKKA